MQLDKLTLMFMWGKVQKATDQDHFTVPLGLDSFLPDYRPLTSLRAFTLENFCDCKFLLCPFEM